MSYVKGKNIKVHELSLFHNLFHKMTIGMRENNITELKLVIDGYTLEINKCEWANGYTGNMDDLSKMPNDKINELDKFLKYNDH
jgi:hypothetical protein